MESKKSAYLVINFSVAFIVASILEMTLHECGHFTAGLIFHAQPVLHHNFVNCNVEFATTSQKICFAAAGPMVSLLIGILCGLVIRVRWRTDMGHLLLLFLSVFGYIGFFGYMAVAPFFTYGDTGFVLQALGCPVWLVFVLAGSSVAALYLILSNLARYFVSFMSTQTAGARSERSKFVVFMIVIPTMTGIAVTTLLNMPVPTALSLINPLCSPFAVFWVYHSYLVASPAHGKFDDGVTLGSRISVAGIAALIAVVIINRLLVPGISI